MRIKRPLRRLSFHLLSGLAQLLGRGGYRRVQRWGRRLGRAHYHLRTGLRRKLVHQMAELGQKTQNQLLIHHSRDILKQAFESNDQAILEVLSLYTTHSALEPLLPPIEMQKMSHLEQAIAYKRGVILLGMHMGNGLAMAHKLQKQIGPIHIVYRESNKVSSGFFRDGIERLGLSSIDASGPDGGFRRMLRALRSEQAVMILMDQASKHSGQPIPFLGKSLRMPPGPIELARRSHAPVVPIWLIDEGQSWVFEVKPPMQCNPSDKIEGQLSDLVNLMEQHILAHPALWSWHQRRWHKYPFITDSGTQ